MHTLNNQHTEAFHAAIIFMQKINNKKIQHKNEAVFREIIYKKRFWKYTHFEQDFTKQWNTGMIQCKVTDSLCRGHTFA